jgi:hypothetical protein
MLLITIRPLPDSRPDTADKRSVADLSMTGASRRTCGHSRPRIRVDPVDDHERLTFSNYELASRADRKTGDVICITSNACATRFDNARYIPAEHGPELAKPPQNWSFAQETDIYVIYRTVTALTWENVPRHTSRSSWYLHESPTRHRDGKRPANSRHTPNRNAPNHFGDDATQQPRRDADVSHAGPRSPRCSVICLNTVRAGSPSGARIDRRGPKLSGRDICVGSNEGTRHVGYLDLVFRCCWIVRVASPKSRAA